MSRMLSSRFPVVTVLDGYARWRLALELPRRSADQNVRHVVMQVLVRIAHVGAVEDQRMIQQRAVAIRSVLQLVDEIRQALHVILVELRIARDVLRILGVMRSAVEAGAARRSPDRSATSDRGRREPSKRA